MEYDILPVNKEGIKKQPDRFSIDLNGQEFIFEIMWNQTGQFFSFNLYDNQGSPIVLGRKIVYASDMLAGIVDKRLPDLSIYPIDRSGQAEEAGITFDNFVDLVKLVVVE